MTRLDRSTHVRPGQWLERWLETCADLATLQRSNPMTDAVIEEIDGRMIRVGDQWLADFASCNYLGFDLDPEIIAWVQPAIERWGTHPSWSRLLGSPRPYEDIEERLTDLLGAEDTLVLPTITHIHMSVIPVLAAGGSIFLDRRAHKTIYDGCVAARAHGATVERFRFEDPDHLDELLRKDTARARLVCMDGVNSMTGNAPPLDEFARVCREHDALLYVDDAHGFGLIGERRPDETSSWGMRGNSIVRHFGESYDNVILVGGFSKSYSSLLAFIACPPRLKSVLKVAAPPYLYSGPSPVASLATVLAGFDVNEQRGDAIRADLQRKTARVIDVLDRHGVVTPNRSGLPIIEVPLADHERIGDVGRFLFERGIYVTLAAYPLVPRDEVGFRIQVTAANSDAEIDRLTDVLAELAGRYELQQYGSTSACGGRVNTRLRLPVAWPCYAYLAGGALLTALYMWVPPFAGNPYLMSALSLSATLAILVGIRRNKPAYPAAWTWLAVGQALFFLGDLYTYAYPRLAHHEVPFPSFGDALYLMVYPALMIGLLLAVRRRTPQGDRAGVIDALIITLGAALLSWIFLIAPNIHAADVSGIGKAVSVAYPLGDVLVLAAAVRLAFDGGRRQTSFYFLSLSVLMLLATDAAYLRALLDGTYDGQLIFNAGWIAYYLFFGAAALHPSMRSLVEATPDRERRLSPLRLLLLTAASMIAPAFEMAREWGQADRDPDTMVIIGASVVLFLLVIVRIVGLVKQQERAAAREHVLQSAGAALVAASSTKEIYDAALGALPSLVGPGASARLCVPDGEGLALLASDAGAARPLGPDTAQALGSAAWGQSHAALTAEQRDELELPQACGRALVLPLAVRGECLGLLVVGSHTPLSPLVAAAISSLATKVSLALESDALSVEVHRRESEARFASLVRHATDLITVVGADGVVTYQSPSSERILGYAPEEVVGQPFVRLCAPADLERLRALLDDPGRSDQLLECRLRHCEGHLVDFEVVATDLLGDEHVKGIVLNGRDVSERKAFEQQLSHQAFHDPVTGLPNRVLFADRVQQALARAARDDTGLAVVFLDLDDFKTINDSLGHAAGDDVLREVAARLVATVRPSDTAARFGGDEFAVLLEGVLGAQHAADVAERILDAFDVPVVLDGKQLSVRPSIGIALAGGPDEDSDPGELIRNADAAMYISKRDGKRGYRVFEATMHADVVERLELRADLQRAVDESQFELFFQPVVRLDTNVVSGVEALVRWRHPERGLVQPAQFIPLAEETGLIVELGRWVMFEGCRRAVELQAASTSPLTLAVNLSVKQLQHPDVVADVRAAIEASGIDPSTLVLEITESVMMADAAVAGRRLAELKLLGVRLAMDDFGTGYSSLSYLSRFPVDILKMDRSFLTPGASKQASDLAAAIVSLGETLNMQVVAEGIEQSRQMTALRDLGRDLGQGFFFARPMPFEDTIAWLESGGEEQRAA